MKNEQLWKPTKFVYKNETLRASRDKKEVSISSRLIADKIAEHYQKTLPRYAHGALIDLGCGKVPLYLCYKDLAHSVTCVDWGDSMHETSHLDQECDLCKPLPFPDSSFDTIILSDVLEHIPEPEILWTEMARILKPGGHILLNTPFYYQLHEVPHDYYRYTEYALRRFCELVKLETTSIEAIGGAPEVLTDILAKQCTRIPLVGAMLAQVLQSMTMQCGKVSFFKTQSKKTAASMPLGYFMVCQKDNG